MKFWQFWLLFLLSIATTLFALIPSPVVARSGCCSHHGGVCGCSCCDGSSLSSTCAPYYPQCSRPIYVAPVKTMVPVVYAPIPVAKVVSTLTPIETTKTNKSDNNTMGYIIFGVVVIFLIRIFTKKDKKV